MASQPSVQQLRDPLLAGLLAAAVAHEINNPLVYVLANLRFATDHPLLQSDAAGELRRALLEALSGAELIRDVAADVRRINRGEPAAVASVPLGSVIEAATRHTIVTHRGLGVRIEQVPGPGAIVRANRVLLTLALGNVLVNGVEAAARPEGGGCVTVSVERAGTRMRVLVDNDGPEIPPELRGRLFAPFYTTKPEGTGLGLYLGRTAVRSMGGDVYLDENQSGTRFVVELLLA
jgi:signal transduction histidine kinase